MKRIAEWVLAKDIANSTVVIDALKGYVENLNARLRKKDEALAAIANQETDGSNATVRRMARMAREALDDKTTQLLLGASE